MDVILANLFLLLQVLELPDSLPVSLGQLWIRLLHDHNVRKLMPILLCIVDIIIQLLHIQLV